MLKHLLLIFTCLLFTGIFTYSQPLPCNVYYSLDTIEPANCNHPTGYLKFRLNTNDHYVLLKSNLIPGMEGMLDGFTIQMDTNYLYPITCSTSNFQSLTTALGNTVWYLVHTDGFTVSRIDTIRYRVNLPIEYATGFPSVIDCGDNSGSFIRVKTDHKSFYPFDISTSMDGTSWTHAGTLDSTGAQYSSPGLYSAVFYVDTFFLPLPVGYYGIRVLDKYGCEMYLNNADNLMTIYRPDSVFDNITSCPEPDHTEYYNDCTYEKNIKITTFYYNSLSPLTWNDTMNVSIDFGDGYSMDTTLYVYQLNDSLSIQHHYGGSGTFEIKYDYDIPRISAISSSYHVRDSNFVQISNCLAGIENIPDEMRVFPNPFDNSLYLEIFKDGLSGPGTYIEIFNVTGSISKKLVPENMNKGTVEINTSDMKPGIYFIRVLKDDEVIIEEKLVKYP